MLVYRAIGGLLVGHGWGKAQRTTWQVTPMYRVWATRFSIGHGWFAGLALIILGAGCLKWRFQYGTWASTTIKRHWVHHILYRHQRRRFSFHADRQVVAVRVDWPGLLAWYRYAN